MKKLILFLVFVIIQGCLPMKVKDRTDSKVTSASGTFPPAGSSGSAVDSLTAFQSTVYPLAKARCVSCHISTNQPFFASNDAKTAHDSLISQSKVNFNNIPSSRLVQRLSPESHNCWGNCSDNAKEMQAAIEKWKSLMSAPTATQTNTQTSTSTKTTTTTGTSTSTNTQTNTVTRMNTIAMPIPANLPNGGNLAANFVPITWTLNSPNDSIDPNLTGATFSFDIQKFDEFSYRVKNPRILTPNTGISVSDIRLAVNGVIRPADATYSLVSATVNMSTTATVLSPASMVVLMDKGPAADQLMVSFGSIKSGTLSNVCKNVAGFTSMVKPGFATYCNRCHSGGGFDLVTGTDAAICARALAKTDRTNPANSPLIVKPNTGTNHPGGRIALPQATIDSWINWITSER